MKKRKCSDAGLIDLWNFFFCDLIILSKVPDQQTAKDLKANFVRRSIGLQKVNIDHGNVQILYLRKRDEEKKKNTEN